jgi:integrase
MAKWVLRWRRKVRKTALPGVWELENGDYLVRGQVTVDNRSYEINQVVKAAKATKPLDALNELARLKKERREKCLASRPKQSERFSVYAASLLEQKVDVEEIVSNASIRKWETILRLHLIPRFGDRWVDTLTHPEMLEWKSDLAKGIKSRTYKPRTCNTWLRIMSVICAAASARYTFPNPMAGIGDFPVRRRVHTHEQPNRFEPRQALLFLLKFEEEYEQHYGMLFVMLVTGARPSTIRPLRRSGPFRDYDPKTGILLFRRSQVEGEAMDETKTNLDQTIPLPLPVQQVLNAHIARLNAMTGPMGRSELLFPGETGGFRSRNALDKPMARVCKLLKIPRVTPKGLRRTFKDIARSSKLNNVVEQSISGHKSDEMDFVYGTAFNQEKLEALEMVIRAIGMQPDVDQDDDDEDADDGDEVEAAE